VQDTTTMAVLKATKQLLNITFNLQAHHTKTF
jgi:hypothetical protein